MTNFTGTDADDTLDGESSDDQFIGRGGNDTILLSADFGQDLVRNTGADTTDRDRIIFDETIDKDLVRLTTVFERNNDNGSALLRIDFDGDGSRIEHVNFLEIRIDDTIGKLTSGLRDIVFSDGSTIRLDEGLPLTGNDGTQRMRGSEFDDTMRGEGGTDLLRGGAGADLLFGGDGNDNLLGHDVFGLNGQDADTLSGGAGDDELNGQGGNDTFLFSAGFGQDIIRSSGAGSADADVIVFDESVQREDVRLFTRNDVEDRNKSADLFIRLDPDGSTVTLLDFIRDVPPENAGQLDNGLREIRFADGQVIRFEDGLLLEGGSGNDKMRGTAFDDTIIGNGGSDFIEANNGDDVLFGGTGDDDLFGGNGNDLIVGDGDNDHLRGSAGADTLSPGSGENFVDGGSGDDVAIFSGDILDYKHDCIIDVGLLLSGDIDTVGRHIVRNVETLIFNGTEFRFSDFENTQIIGTASGNLLAGGGDRDFLAGLEGDDTIDGQGGDDFVNAGEDNDLVIGNAGDDILDGGDGIDTLSFAGTDGAITVDLAANRVSGSLGNDTLARFEVVLGGNGNDVLTGDEAANDLSGGSGDDTLQGGAGNDTLTGGGGDDRFTFAIGDGADRILGFQAGNQTEDRLDVSALGFTRFGDVLAIAANGAEGVVLAFGGGTSVLLEGIQAGDLSADDFVLAPDTTIPLQRIDPAEDAFIVGGGDQIAVTGVYATANPVDETLTGIGVRVHFNSSVLRFDGLENLFATALQPFGQVAETDSGNFDNDASTDTFVALNWADLGGAFPGDGATPLDLFDILFTGLGGVADTNINFSASSVANGRQFASTSVSIAADRWPLPDTVEVAENSAIDLVVADLAPAVVDPIDPGAFTLLDDAGGRFVLDGFVLEVATGDVLDFEALSSHSVTLRIINNAGGSIDRQITVDLTDVNEAPTVISIDQADIDEDAESGDQVGILAALDPEDDVIDFTLVDDAGGRFALDGDRLVVAGGGLDFETAQSHAITLRATDTDGLSLDQVLNININDIAEATLDLDGDGQVNALTDGLIALGELFNAPLSQLTALAAPGSPGVDGSVLSGALDAARAEIFDVDDNGTADALTDGLMILSHLFAAPADQVAGFAAPDAARADPQNITAFLDNFIPADATA